MRLFGYRVVTSIRCTSCGRFMKHSEKTTREFIPDSLYSKEEELHHCENCTVIYGKPVSVQWFYPRY